MENHEEITGTSAWSPLELGTWIGKSQAFGAIAKSCTGAEAACLKQIRDYRSYESLGLTWEQFCPQHIGISRLSADRLIGRLEEFGEPYFQLAGMTRISAESFLIIAPVVTEEGLEVDGPGSGPISLGQAAAPCRITWSRTLAHYRTVTVPVAIIFAAASGGNFQFLSKRPSATTEASEPLKKI
jgi:hypothetical protein